MARVLWTTFTMGSTEWSVFWADRDDLDLKPDHDDEDPLEGCTLYAKRVILIRSDLPKKAMPSVLLHEIRHASWFESGVGKIMELSSEKEEQIIHSTAHLEAQALITGGFWKMRRK